MLSRFNFVCTSVPDVKKSYRIAGKCAFFFVVVVATMVFLTVLFYDEEIWQGEHNRKLIP